MAPSGCSEAARDGSGAAAVVRVRKLIGGETFLEVGFPPFVDYAGCPLQLVIRCEDVFRLVENVDRHSRLPVAQLARFRWDAQSHHRAPHLLFCNHRHSMKAHEVGSQVRLDEANTF